MAIKPGKYDPLKPDIELFDYKSKKRYGLKLSGSSALQVGTISQDDTVHIRTAGKRIGDFDEQASWKGGRGVENLSSNPSGFWDSENMWTLSERFAYPTLLWQFSKGLRSADMYLPGSGKSMYWQSLISTSRYVQMPFTSSGFVAASMRLWIKRLGTPGTLTVELRDGSSALATATITTSDVTDFISVFHKFAVAQTLSASTYYIRIYGASTDDKNNHWKIGGYNGGTNGTMSSNGSSFSSAGFDMYYYVADADIARTFFPFFLDGAMYVVDKKDNGTTASKLYINGDRFKATSATATTAADSTKAWTTNKWAGARAKIVRGTGAGQTRQITSNTSTTLTVPTWTTTPDTTSEIIIYDTDWFTEISTTGLTVVSSAPIVSNQIVYFPQGSAVNIRRMIWNPSTNAHVFSDDSTNKASFLAITTNNVVQIWLAVNSTSSGGAKIVCKANAAAWANPPTALSFGTQVAVGDATYPITNIAEKDGLLYITKEDGVYHADVNVKITRLQSGVEKTPSSSNGAGIIVHQQFMYYSWLHSLIRVYGSSHDDIGQDWSGYGLPDGREGIFASLDSYTSLLLAGIDAGTGTSSVLAWDGLGFHEILRAYGAGERIRMVKVQPCQDARNRLWVDVGGVLIYQAMPFQKGAPWLDSGILYMHEGVIESAAIDMGTASGLPKFIKELVAYTENLGEGNRIEVDYQVDDDVHTDNWVNATTLYLSPESTAFLGLNNIRKFAYRLRIICGDNTNPPRLRGVTPNGYARVPYKMVWTLRCQADNISSRGRLVKPDQLMRWLLDNARFPGRIEMLSQYELAHKYFVIIHPPRMFPFKPSQNGQAEESVFTIVLEEA